MPYASTEAHRQWSKDYRLRNKEQVDTTKARWRLNNQDKRKAQNAVNNALRSGKLTKGPCEFENDDCTPNCKIQGHHDDYAKPLEVRWLCPWHHKQVDLGKMS